MTIVLQQQSTKKPDPEMNSESGKMLFYFKWKGFSLKRSFLPP